MGAGVSHDIAGIIVWAKTRSLGIIPKSKLQNGHSGESEAFANRFHLRRNHTEIFSENRQVAQLRFDNCE